MAALKASVIPEETAQAVHDAMPRGQIMPWPDDVGRAGNVFLPAIVQLTAKVYPENSRNWVIDYSLYPYGGIFFQPRLSSLDQPPGIQVEKVF